MHYEIFFTLIPNFGSAHVLKPPPPPRDCVVIAIRGERQSGSKASNPGLLDYGKSSLALYRTYSYAWHA